MALTWYRVLKERVQLPNGTTARTGDNVQVDDSLAAAMVTAGLLVATVDFSAQDPMFLTDAVVTGDVKIPVLRPKGIDGMRDMLGPQQLRTNVAGVTAELADLTL